MTSYIHKEKFEVLELDGESVILNSEAFMVTTLNEVGGFCWSLLHEACTIRQIVQTVRTHYVIEDESIEQDIARFVTHLMDCGLIRHAS